jgi:hypothetical protein
MYAMSSITNPTYQDKAIVNNLGYQQDAVMVAKNALKLAKIIRAETQNWQYDNSAN